jgi:hypothetical protein
MIAEDNVVCKKKPCITGLEENMLSKGFKPI